MRRPGIAAAVEKRRSEILADAGCGPAASIQRLIEIAGWTGVAIYL